MDLHHVIWATTLVISISADLPDRENFCTYQQSQGLPEWINDTCSAHYLDPAAQTIQSLYASVAAADCELANPCNFPPHYSPTDWEEFDFIIVGAGSAGSVLANRLTEVSGWTVLLLEAGGNPDKTTEVPAFSAYLQGSDIDWKYKTDPKENNCLGMKDNRCNWSRGKVLGGTSTINYMYYFRGNPKDYNSWAEEGNVGWSYEDILPYFKKSEDMRAEEVLANSNFKDYHATGGYLKVETFPNYDVRPLANYFAEGMKELGYGTNSDVNGETQSGFVTAQGTLEDGRRCSTAKAFLSSAKGRHNLKVSKHSLASKVLINEKTKTAYGVTFINEFGKIVNVRARKEVILSAGAINTPQLLMLSGIGPRKHLKQLNIKVIKDLAVGRNLQDHPAMASLVISLNFSKPIESPEKSMFDFLLNRNSSLSTFGLSSYVTFINTIRGVDYPDVLCLLVDFPPNGTTELSALLDIFGFREYIKNKYLELNIESYIILLFCPSLRPYSRGRIELKSTNPKRYPKITAGYFSDERDIKTFLRTYNFISQLVDTEGLKKVNAELHEIEIPDCSNFPLGSKKYRECSLRYLTVPNCHYCCTCKMGPANSHDSVVDPLLRVIGIKRLRIVDASVMPTEITGALNAPVIMIAEKASDLIKGSWYSESIWSSKTKVSNKQIIR